MVSKEIQNLQNRVVELERQLAEAQASIKQGHLSASDEYFRQAILAAPLPLMIRRDDGKVLMVNEAWTEITGYTLEDIPTIAEWTRKAYGKYAPQRLSLIRNQGFSQEGIQEWGEFEVTTRLGEKRTWDFSSAPLGIDSKGRRLGMTMAVDITEHRTAQQALIEAQEHLRQLNSDLEQRNIEVEVERMRWQSVVEGIADEVWVCDAQGKMSLINLDMVTDMGLEEFRDRSVDEVLQEVEILHPNGQVRPPEQAPLLRSLSGEIVRGEEIMRHRRTGKVRYRQYSSAPTRDAQGHITGAVAIVRDVTEFKQAEEKIAYQAWLLANINDAIVGSDAQFRLTAWNATAESMYGWKAEEVLGRNGLEILQTQWPQEDSNEMRRMIAEAGRWRGEATQRRKDGTRIPVEVSSAVLRDERGQITGYVSINRDITDRQRAEEKRRLAEERYTTLFNAVREGFAHYKAVYDDRGKLSDILVVEINPAGAKLSGVAREDQVGKTWRQVWPGVADELFAMYQHVDETGENLRFDDDNHLTGRIYGVVISKVAPGEFIATFNDITDRKQAEERLAYQAKLLSSVHHAVVATNEQMRITYWNEAAEEIFGWKAEEVLGQSTLELLQTKVPNSTREEAVRSLMETGRYEGEVLYRRKDGTYFTAYAWAAVLGSTQGGSKGLVTSVQDITQRKRAEEALQKSEERFNKAFHASPNALVISRQEDGRIETINDTFVRFFGYSEEEVIGKTSIELGMFANPVDRQEAVRRLQKDKSVHDFELDVQLKSGEIRNVSLSIEMIEIGGEHAMLTMIQDITERKQAEQALRESEQQLKRAEEIAHLGSWELDLVNNRLIWSDEVYRIFGLEPQEFGATYEAFLEAVHPDDRHAVDDAYSSSIREGRDAYEIEHRVVKRSSGEVRIVHEKCEHFRNHGGQIVRSTGMVHDITERKQAEEALLESERQLKRSNKDLQDFAFTASHDLQEPLRKIEMFGELLQKWAPQLDEQGRDYIERMRNAAKRMRATVDGLLQLSRVATRGKPFVQVDLSQLITEVLSDLEAQIRRTNGKVDVGALPPVEGDPLQLRQLMQNLISNALKYHHPGTPPEVKVYAKQMSRQVQILVEDKGIGFEQEEAEHIFQPFVRLVGRSQYEGSGMGLAICRRIVERHGGEITAHSKPGEGTTFLVTLPSHHAESARNE